MLRIRMMMKIPAPPMPGMLHSKSIPASGACSSTSSVHGILAFMTSLPPRWVITKGSSSRGTAVCMFSFMEQRELELNHWN